MRYKQLISGCFPAVDLHRLLRQKGTGGYRSGSHPYSLG